MTRGNLIRSRHTCPWWLIYSFDNPIRRIYQNPALILRPYLNPGDIALDLGCGMGYFSLPMARLVGPSGTVYAADVQRGMLAGLTKRAARARLDGIIQPHLCSQSQIGLPGPVDFVLLMWMLHEIRQPRSILREVSLVLKPGGRMLIAEPLIHVSKAAFQKSLELVQDTGFEIQSAPRIGLSRAALAVRQG